MVSLSRWEAASKIKGFRKYNFEPTTYRVIFSNSVIRPYAVILAFL
jgi:hypothetical protein